MKKASALQLAVQQSAGRLLPLAGLLTLTVLAAGTARADDSGDNNFVRIGGEHVVFHDSNPGFTGPGVPPGVSLQTQVQDLNTVYLSYARNLTPNWELELIAGVPPNFEVHMRGPETVGALPYRNQVAVTGKQMAPSFTFNYKFNDPSSFYRPYFGVGLVYSHFYDITPSATTNAVNGGPTSLTFTDSLGALVTAGVSFRLVDHFRANLSITRADVRPNVTSVTDGVRRINYYDLGPVVFTGSLSYGF